MLRRVLASLAVLATCAGAAWAALAVVSIERTLDVGTVRVSADAHHEGALDLYVPLVDWGVRFPGAVACRPGWRSTCARSIAAAGRAAGPGRGARRRRRARPGRGGDRGLGDPDARAWPGVAALALGLLVALALRGRAAPLRAAGARGGGRRGGRACSLLFLLVPPRGELADPEYYANGPGHPGRAARDRQRPELRGHDLRGARRPARGPRAADRRPRGARRGHRLGSLTLASDLHNNLLALPALERAVDGGPLVFAGDLTDRGSPFEATLTARVAHVGRPGGVRGRQPRLGHARPGPAAGGGGGARHAGSSAWPGCGWRAIRRRTCACDSERYRDRGAEITDAQRQEFADWLRPLVGKVDVVVAHEQGLAETAAEELRRNPPRRAARAAHGPHPPRGRPGVGELRGAQRRLGGRRRHRQPGRRPAVRHRRLLYERDGGFRPRFADTVEIDADSGAARAERLPVGGAR